MLSCIYNIISSSHGMTIQQPWASQWLPEDGCEHLHVSHFHGPSSRLSMQPAQYNMWVTILQYYLSLCIQVRNNCVMYNITKLYQMWFCIKQNCINTALYYIVHYLFHLLCHCLLYTFSCPHKLIAAYALKCWK